MHAKLIVFLLMVPISMCPMEDLPPEAQYGILIPSPKSSGSSTGHLGSRLSSPTPTNQEQLPTSPDSLSRNSMVSVPLRGNNPPASPSPRVSRCQKNLVYACLTTAGLFMAFFTGYSSGKNSCGT